jgi:hypothetical protein
MEDFGAPITKRLRPFEPVVDGLEAFLCETFPCDQASLVEHLVEAIVGKELLHRLKPNVRELGDESTKDKLQGGEVARNSAYGLGWIDVAYAPPLPSVGSR